VDESVGWLVPLDNEEALITSLISVASNPERPWRKAGWHRKKFAICATILP
jgi:hypothetical protein